MPPSVAASALFSLVKLPRLSGSNFWLSLIPHSTPSPPRFAPESTSINEPTINPDDVKPSLRSDIRPFPTKAVDFLSPDPTDSRLEIPVRAADAHRAPRKNPVHDVQLRKKRSARIARSDSRSVTGATLAHQPSLAEPSTMSFHPQTPQSPSQFSSGTSEPALGVANSMTATATATTLPTPAHSVSGSASHHDVAMTDNDSPHKRKRSVDDSGDREQKKVHVEESKLGIEDLHLDVGKKYLLCQTPHLESLPRISEDLYDMFNLTGLAAEVAREKPNGEKNALRSSYTGHIKRLGIAGHFKVQKVENRGENDPQEESDFAQILHLGDEDWNNSFVRGREISLGLSQASLSSLGRAVTMAKGSIKKDVWDTSVLGLQSSNGELKQPSSARPTAPNTPLNVPGAVGRLKAQGASANDPNRPRRNIKKRTYGDSSFEGYGEGYPDDDNAMEGGYSTGEGEGSQKRRKKNPGNASPYPSAMRQQSYGPGMVGA
ncbi:hypothetical protein CDV36_013764 [Fusarium kuroshium]|uniref:Mediator of RNA polymerase II transcription subunit 19 n=1 Tax=Fusarium kuroshium TaxID=2010991 RepID=A0A3M2RMS4_9HYPO|nr:hypothetical protein CDV36_013764 [Fusarium kuroshium]